MTEEEEGGGEGFEEWDADFLNQLIHVEERALSSSSSSTFTPSFQSSSFTQPLILSDLPPLPSSTPWNPRKNLPPPPPIPLSFSPPRELSQRPPPDSDARRQIGWPPPTTTTKAPRSLKDGGETRNKRGRRRDPQNQPPSKPVCPPYQDKGKASLEGSKGNKSLRERDVEPPPSVSLGVTTADATDDQIRFRADIEANFRAVGVQTDEATESTGLPSLNEFRGHQKLSNNLRFIWYPPKAQQLPSAFLSKLFVACHPLFCTMNADRSFQSGADCVSDKFSVGASEVAMVSKFYSAFIEVSNGMARLETLFQPLFDLCSVENVALLSGSLNIMYLILDHMLTIEQCTLLRNNVVWKGLPTIHDARADHFGNKECGFHPSVSCSVGAPTVFASTDHMSTTVKSKLGMGDFKCGTSVYSSNLISIFGLMHGLIKRNTEECVRLGAVSVMRSVLLKGNAYEDRVKFPLPQAFESVLILLKKDSGKKLQEEALHLLFLLLNCPKIFEAFVVNCEDVGNSLVESHVGDKIISGIDDILESVAECVSYGGGSIQDLILRRKAIVLVAFIASSGSKGFEIVMNTGQSNERNILVEMLRALVLDLDIEARGSTKSPEIGRERNLLMREALILLNRLMSNPSSSAACLRLLTNTRDTASLTINFASRMCKSRPRAIQTDSDRLIGVHDLDDLARAFRRRVFAYLGDRIT
ncbi:hypothetical protein MLD38_019084 [Melastoma candidum]|uniref:Uncharacterized protein n=1 Tax=Melastoma candidum TaxID=119954 RepID=A0ACB9QZC4_9MYRT|nr:hypothetical protein MLD38_019084 [Melastoma candidum]